MSCARCMMSEFDCSVCSCGCHGPIEQRLENARADGYSKATADIVDWLLKSLLRDARHAAERIMQGDHIPKESK